MDSNQLKMLFTAEQSFEMDLSNQHLQAELARIDVLIRRQIRLWQLAGQDINDAFRGLYVSDTQAENLLDRPIFGHWGSVSKLDFSEQKTFGEMYHQAELSCRALINTARSQGDKTRLEHLLEEFCLDRFELDILLVCLAPALDLRYEKLYGYLQDDVTLKHPSINLILDLLCGQGIGRLSKLFYFSSEGNLFKNLLIQNNTEHGRHSLLGQSLSVSPSVIYWLLGQYTPDDSIRQQVSYLKPQQDDLDGLLIQGTKINQLNKDDEESFLVFTGPDKLCQDATARYLAVNENRFLLTFELATPGSAEQDRLNTIKLAFRDARLTDALLYLKGWDERLPGGEPDPGLLSELFNFPRKLILACNKLWQPKGIYRQRRLIWFDFPIPDFNQRYAIWNQYLGRELIGEETILSQLAGQFQLDSRQIRDSVASAYDLAELQGGGLNDRCLFAAARLHSSSRLAELAHQITPRYSWDDIVLPVDQLAQLREIVVTVRERPKVLDDWGLGRKLVSSRGITALFAGPPGTGKTMAAEIIANELRLDLFKIDLSTVVSKYIGETEKNLEGIFFEAETSNAILFFDEADALFGKRSEVRDSHDRYANIEISYLLQRMEIYNGVSILATNLRANLDEAFTRRLQFAVDFPFPDATDRLLIWKTLFPAELPRVEELDFDYLSQNFKLAGGNIRNILVNAAYLAATDGHLVTMEHLQHSVRRELQKMGRLINER